MRAAMVILVGPLLISACVVSAPAPTGGQSPSQSQDALATLPTTAAPILEPTPTPHPQSNLDVVDCADVDLLLRTVRDQRGESTPASAPAATTPPANATTPPLGQFLLADSPLSDFPKPAFVGFLRTAQDLGSFATGQTLELAQRTGLLWAYTRSWTPETGPGGFSTSVYEFSSEQGARDFDEGAARGACLNGGSLFIAPGLGGAIGQRYALGFPTYAVRVSFLKAKRRYLVQLVTMTPTESDRIMEVARIAAAAAR